MMLRHSTQVELQRAGGGALQWPSINRPLGFRFRNGRWVAVLLVAAAMVVCGRCDADEAEVTAVLRPFLKHYCIPCHGPETQKAERRFDGLDGTIADSNALADYQDILDQLNLGQMPPDDKPQPTDDERRALVAWLTRQITDWHATHRNDARQTVLRRLNSREYRNTIGDLLHLNTLMFHPDESFPKDQVSEHLDNIGESLVMSGFLLQQYFEAAARATDKIFGSVQQPAVRTWTFRSNFRQQPEIDQFHGKTNEFSRLTLYDVRGADKPEGAYAPLLAFREGVPADGWYDIRFRATAVNRVHPYDPEFVGTDPDEPFRLGIVAGHSRVGPLHKPQPIEPLLAVRELSDETAWYSERVWLDQGYTPRFTFENGLMDVRDMWGRLVKRYADQFPAPSKPGIVEARFNAIRYGQLPQIHIHEVEISGPHFDEWPTASQRAVLGEDWQAAADGVLPDDQLRKHLLRFVERAYRRSVTDEELEPAWQVVVTRRGEGRSPLEAYRDGVRTVLCSPGFLYLTPVDPAADSDWGLASRLSYFLWSSMPDDELSELAGQGLLRRPDILAAQVDRMLDHPRSDAFVSGFADSWLNLRDLGSMPPDRGQFRRYYRDDLGAAMREETCRFIRCLLDENLSIEQFLDSDFQFVNRPLARLYGMPLPEGFEFTRVERTDHRRGGLLGQASVLTVTANGIDTSPVVRGVWLLETILGDPPTPPPPYVEPLDPDVRGTTTIREQLEKHRSSPSCYDCHRSIDPMGFAMENFDAIGAWRDRYQGRVTVDASGEMPDGQRYTSIEEFKQILLGRSDQFARALTGRLLAYATGRNLSPADRLHVDGIVEKLRTNGYGLRDLVTLVVATEPFQSP